MNREQLSAHVENIYSAQSEYLWPKYPDAAVFRRSDNRKWFGIMMKVSENKLGLSGDALRDIVILKCGPLLVSTLILRDGFVPAYHMNKQNWIGILLDGAVSDEELMSLIDLSYDMASGKKRTK